MLDRRSGGRNLVGAADRPAEQLVHDRGEVERVQRDRVKLAAIRAVQRAVSEGPQLVLEPVQHGVAPANSLAAGLSNGGAKETRARPPERAAPAGDLL